MNANLCHRLRRVLMPLVVLPLLLPLQANGPTLTVNELQFNKHWVRYISQKLGCREPRDTSEIRDVTMCEEPQVIDYHEFLEAKKYAKDIFNLKDAE